MSPPTTKDSAVSTRALDLSIGGVQIVRGISLDIFHGELIGIIGPNGAGKTSLLNLLTGTTRASGGTISMFGRDVTRLAPHRRARMGVGRTFQTSYLLLGLTVLENVRLVVQAELVRGAKMLRLVTHKDETIAQATEALVRVGLAHKRHLLASELSHGDRRKLEIALVLAGRARLILLDEPMAGVNAEDVDGLMDLIRVVRRENNATILMVEHHMHVVLGLADRVAVMHHGAVLAFDSPEAVMTDDRVQTAYLGEPL